MDKLIITIAPTGNVPTKELNPSSPLTPLEIANDLIKCRQIGASVAHLHARNSEMQPTHSRVECKKVLDEIKKKEIDIITCISTGVRGGPNTIESRTQMLNLDSDMASIAPGSSNFSSMVNVNTPEMINAMAEKMYKNGIKPEVEIFDAAFLENTKFLIKKGILKAPIHFNFVLGVPGSIDARPQTLLYLIDSLPPKSSWSVIGVGGNQLPVITMGILFGGHVRTGLEDTIMYKKNQLATNTMLVERVVRIAKELNREVATTDEAREMLSL